MVVLLTTDDGQPVCGEVVQALMLAPRGSRVALERGSTLAITDVTGRATFSLSVPHGDMTNVILTFGSSELLLVMGRLHS